MYTPAVDAILLLEQMILCIFAIFKATGEKIRRAGEEDEDSVEEWYCRTSNGPPPPPGAIERGIKAWDEKVGSNVANGTNDASPVMLGSLILFV